MNARDLMNRDVVKVAPDTPLREVAKTLISHGISAVPVVDESGTLVGMVSEGDLVGRKKTERESRSEWWLMRLAEGEPLSGQFLDHLQSPLAVAREVMSTPVITVGEETRVDEIAGLMAEHRVKRVPVLSEGRIVNGFIDPVDPSGIYRKDQPSALKGPLLLQKVFSSLERLSIGRHAYDFVPPRRVCLYGRNGEESEP